MQYETPPITFIEYIISYIDIIVYLRNEKDRD